MAVSSQQQTYHEPGPVRTKQGFQYTLECLVDIGRLTYNCNPKFEFEKIEQEGDQPGPGNAISQHRP